MSNELKKLKKKGDSLKTSTFLHISRHSQRAYVFVVYTPFICGMLILFILDQFALNFGRNLTTAAIKSGFERISLLYLPVKLTDRLTKDITQSAVRKAQKLGRLRAAIKIPRTALFAQILPLLSQFLVEVGIIIYECKLSKAKNTKSVWRLILRKAKQYMYIYLASAAGAAIGTLIYPGTMTMICSVLAEVSVMLIV